MMEQEEKRSVQVNISNLFCYDCSTSFFNLENFKSHHCHNISESNQKSPTKKFQPSQVKEDTKKLFKSTKTRLKIADHKTMTTQDKMNRVGKSFYGRVKGVNGKTVVVKSRPVVKDLEDYMHCCRCYITFYKLPDLLKHFKDCQVEKSDTFQEYKTKNKKDRETSIKIVSVASEDTIVNVENNVEANNNREIKDDEDECLPSQEEGEIKPLVTMETDYEEDPLDSPDSPSSPSSPINQDTKTSHDIDIDVLSNCSRSSSPCSVQVKEEEEEEGSEIKSEDDDDYTNKKSKRRRKVKRTSSKSSSSSFPTADPSNIEFPFLTCPICFRIFNTPDGMKRHVLIHGEKNFKCHVCPFSCRVRPSLYSHVRNKHPGVHPYTCYKYPACPMTFATFEEQKSHRTSHRPKRYYCSEPGCTRSYKAKGPLDDHLNSHKNLRPHVCEKCAATFVTANQLYSHFITHRIPSHKCEFEGCDKIYKTVTLLKAHMASHSTEKPFKCTVTDCDAAYTTEKQLKHHVKIMHAKEQESLCPLCGKSFLRKAAFDLHLLVHSQEKNFKCTFEGCSLTFLTKANLKRHMNTHIGERKHECRWSSCGKKFTSPEARKRHEQTHSQSKPFACAFCDSKFPDNRPLKKHVLESHEEEEFDINVPTSYRAQKTNVALT